MALSCTINLPINTLLLLFQSCLLGCFFYNPKIKSILKTGRRHFGPQIEAELGCCEKEYGIVENVQAYFTRELQ